MAITITDIVTEYGAYYLNHGQNTSNLSKVLHRPSVTAGYFATMPTTETVMRFGAAEMDRALQPFQKAFTPIGTLTFTPNPIDLFNLKIDKQEYPDDIVKSWVGFLEGEGIDRAQWPFVRWMLEEHIIPQAIEDFELNEVYAGNYAAPTPGTAGAAGTAMDGIGTILSDNSALVNTVTTGAPPTDPADFCSYVEDFIAAFSNKEYRKRVDYIFMSEDNELLYRQGKDAKYNTNYAQETSGATIKYFPNASVVGLPSMGTSNTLWSTLKANRIRPLKKAEMGTPMVKEFSARLVSIYTDWWTVCSFRHMQSVFVNDQP